MFSATNEEVGSSRNKFTQGGAEKPIAQLKINLFSGGICEMLIGGDEKALRAALVKNLGKIAASLRA